MAIIKYVIADDHKIFRQGLRFALADDHKLKLTGEAENGIELIKLIEKQKPDVILLDLKMPEMDGIEVTKQIQISYPYIKILMLTTYDDAHFILHLMELGANGYLLKNADPDEIKKAIHEAHQSGYYFNDLVSSAMLKKILNKGQEKPKVKEAVQLTQREQEVLKMICDELTTQEIAARIFLSPRTIEGIRSDLIEKTGARNTAGLVLFALKNNIYN